MSKETYNNIEFDSGEEVQFYKWLVELKKAGYINEILPQPEPFILSKPFQIERVIIMKRVANKVKQDTIMNGHIYTCDFHVKWSEKMNVTLFNRLLKQRLVVMDSETFFEVKPSFDQNNMTRLAKINIKWVFHNEGKLVQMVIPKKVFAHTFTPLGCLTTPTGKPRKIKHKVVLIDEFLKTI